MSGCRCLYLRTLICFPRYNYAFKHLNHSEPFENRFTYARYILPEKDKLNQTLGEN